MIIFPEEDSGKFTNLEDFKVGPWNPHDTRNPALLFWKSFFKCFWSLRNVRVYWRTHRGGGRWRLLTITFQHIMAENVAEDAGCGLERGFIMMQWGLPLFQATTILLFLKSWCFWCSFGSPGSQGQSEVGCATAPHLIGCSPVWSWSWLVIFKVNALLIFMGVQTEGVHIILAFYQLCVEGCDLISGSAIEESVRGSPLDKNRGRGLQDRTHQHRHSWVSLLKIIPNEGFGVKKWGIVSKPVVRHLSQHAARLLGKTGAACLCAGGACWMVNVCDVLAGVFV